MSRTDQQRRRAISFSTGHRLSHLLTVTATLALAVFLPATARSAANGQSGPRAFSIPAGSPTLSTTDRLDDRRYVAAGTRAYDVGSEAGHYWGMGWHITGEMGITTR